MKKIMSETPQAEFGGIFKVANKIQLPPFEWPLHRETRVQRFMWLSKIIENLCCFLEEIDNGRELFKNYGYEIRE